MKMPKPTKLHPKGKPNSMQKIYNVEMDNIDSTDAEQSVRQFQLELCWCIQQLERSLNEKKGTEKQLQESWKVLTVLKNNNQPIIRKRQLMRTHFGDYRAKMAAEEKKLAKMASKMKIAEKPEQPKATFLRKSAFLSTGDSSFRFNFNLTPDQIDIREKTDKNTDSTNITTGNTEETKPDSKAISKDNSNIFRFTFSESGFKFNFNVDNA